MSAQPSAAPCVYIVIINWHGADDTIECLDSVFALSHPNFRVVVCDNGSTDDSLERIRGWAEGEAVFSRPSNSPLQGVTTTERRVAVVELDRDQAERGEGDDAPLTLVQTGENLGFAGGNNVALRWILARGDAEYIWLLNNDTVCHPDALSALVSVLDQDTCLGAVGSKLLLYGEPGTLQAAGGGPIVPWQGLAINLGEFEHDRGQWDEPMRLECIIGASLCVRREAFEETGLLDEQYFMYSEELDWCVRLRRAGWELGYVPGSRVWHKVGRSVGGASPARDYFTVRSTFLWVKKFYPTYLPFAALYGVYRYILPKLARGEFRRLHAVLRAHADFLTGRPARGHRPQ